MTKQVYELTAADLERHPVWVFPMDDSVEDEASLRPVKRGEIVPDGLQRIGRAVFTDGIGRSWTGYMYLGGGVDVEDARPVAWCNDVCITFWNGMIAPSREYLVRIRDAGIQWPVHFRTDADGVEARSGMLAGVYFMDGKAVRLVEID